MAIPLTLPKRYGTGFLADYAISRQVRAGQPQLGLPELRYAQDRRGQRVLVKSWAYDSDVHGDLLPFWHEEMRLLGFISTQRASEGLLARLLAAGVDDNGFHVICTRDGRHLLADESKITKTDQSISFKRKQVWRNLARLARGLQLLHDYGTIHRNVDTWSVLTERRSQGDFLLTGFEWSTRVVRLSSIDGSVATLPNDESSWRIGSLQDWRDFAQLAKQLLMVNSEEELHGSERAVIQQCYTSTDIDGRVVAKTIDRIWTPKRSARSSPQMDAIARVSDTEEFSTKEYGFLLLQLVQSAYAAATEYPVEVVQSSPRSVGVPRGKHQIHFRIKGDDDRQKLAMLLGHKEPFSERLHAALDESKFVTDTWYFIGDDVSIDSGEAQGSELYFQSVHDDAERIFAFETSYQRPQSRSGVLVSARNGRSDQQFRRQLKAWRAFHEDLDLGRSLERPEVVNRQVRGVLKYDENFYELDDDKQSALRSIIETAPLFLTHGPPGVGKTRLVSALCQQLIGTNKNSKVLLSAQSHAAVDHLLDGVAKLSLSDILIVRCRSRDSSRSASKFDLEKQAKKVLEAFRDSASFGLCSDSVRNTTRILADGMGGEDRYRAERFQRRPLDALLLRSAHLVFGTTNCAAFEHLLAEHVRFDWSLVEEAAKATGNELLTPLLFAQRQVLIGDHRQLPPFNSDEIASVLKSPKNVVELMRSMTQIKMRHLQETDVQRFLQSFNGKGPNTPGNAKQLCEAALKSLHLFESLITPAYSPTQEFGCTYARMLSYQHRMHPAIARVVSHAYYSDKLKSDQRCMKRFAETIAPAKSANPERLPNVPLVWIDMPWTQTTMGSKIIEKRPGPYNTDEVRMLLKIVSTLEPEDRNSSNSKPPTLALLTPYRRQVISLSTAIENASEEFRRHLRRFDAIGTSYVHTVDSFQGNEADVVIISLVRNNHRASLSGALGFLKDERRMNVLMSRAKWRLIVVGSLQFLQSAVDSCREGSDSNAAGFLRLLFEQWAIEKTGGHAAIMSPW